MVFQFMFIDRMLWDTFYNLFENPEHVLILKLPSSFASMLTHCFLSFYLILYFCYCQFVCFFFFLLLLFHCLIVIDKISSIQLREKLQKIKLTCIVAE